ncbi:MAG: hypothetical protein ACOH2F_04840 [Cellulomonas sp.]
MRHLARSLAAVALGAASVVAFGLPASAQDPACEQQTGYGASNVCVVDVAKADPICPANTLQLQYVVTAEGTPATTVDLHWINPSGANVVQTGLPFTGTVDWPTSIPQKATEVQFVVGTDVVVNVDPTAALETCSSSKVLSVSDTTSGSQVLAFTGSEIMPYALAAGGLLFAGTALILVRSARSRRVEHVEQ